MTVALSADGLGKRYSIGETTTAYRSIRDSWDRLFKSRVSAAPREFWALRDVSFSLEEGEVLGVIGRNGAGKSTLLKLLSRITTPTEGSCRVRGRVGALLEVGSGFHPELTGRENICLNGAILGMSRKEIAARFDEIVAFAEIEQFIDTPVKRYSSGMYVRLAFSVAAHLEPDILIIDEVLAVGDAAFQKKCLDRMGDAGRTGRTALFVSHNMTAVESLCTRALLLDHGSLVADGPPSVVVRGYMGGEKSFAGQRTWSERTAPRSPELALHSLTVRGPGGEVEGSVSCREPFGIDVVYRVQAPGHRVGVIVVVRREEGEAVFSTVSNTDSEWHSKPRDCGWYVSRCQVPSDLLAGGDYTLSVIAWLDNYRMSLNEQEVLNFTVDGPSRARGDYLWRLDGVVRPVLEWQTEALVGPPLELEAAPVDSASQHGAGLA
jgi:lipopolysaccharide transport system ATP-binding protein